MKSTSPEAIINYPFVPPLSHYPYHTSRHFLQTGLTIVGVLMRAITPARQVVLELKPEPHQRSLDIDFELEGIILIVEVKIAVSHKYL
jgi:hypothetical protein